MVRDSFTLAHVTHEAVEHLGGIGTVLGGLITSPVYQQAVDRSILIGPTQTREHIDPEARLGKSGQVLYSSIDQIDHKNLAPKFQHIESAFNIAIVYGTRCYHVPGDNRTGNAEVLLLDVLEINPDRLNAFKLRLWETFGISSSEYEKVWDFEEYARLAEPAYYALLSLLDDDELPCVLISHEFMGMATALQTMLDGQERFRTVFYAHECATARHLVENNPGHDTMFYNVLDQARRQKLYAHDVFGDMEHLFRHVLIKRSHLCDSIVAVGDRTRDELLFLDSQFRSRPIDLVYNGIPSGKVNLDSKMASRKMLVDYSRTLLGHEPDVLMTHITRPVISKGLWRDLKVCHSLDRQLAQHNKTGVLYILTSAAGVRHYHDILMMEKDYGWPRRHQNDYPDLVGPEQDLYQNIVAFNDGHGAVQVVLVNQFGWSQKCIGQRLPAQMTIADLRRATDVEFGMATYEPFGISPLEPLGAGAVCVISSVCGCEGFVRHVTKGQGTPNVITADFTKLGGGQASSTINQLKAMTSQQRDEIEETESLRVADELMRRLPWSQTQRQTLIESGQGLVADMGWDQVVEQGILPMLQRIVANYRKS